MVRSCLLGVLTLAPSFGCGGGEGRLRLEAPAELTEMLEDVIRTCGEGSAEACREAQNAPSGAIESEAVFPPGLLMVSVVESCRSQNFAELEAVVVLKSGTTHIRAGFVRNEDGTWFNKRIVTVDGSTPALCADLPNVHTAEEAKAALADKDDWVRWSRRDGRDIAEFAHLLDYGCGVKGLLIGESPDEEPMRFEVRCWHTDGFPVSGESFPPRFNLEDAPYLYVKLAFTDGTSTAVEKVENPYRKGGA